APPRLSAASALRITAEELPRGTARLAVSTAADRCAAGADPREALAEVQSDLPPTLAGLLELPLGERLPTALSAAAAATAEREEDRRQLAQAVLWPAGVGFVTIAVCAAALAWLGPMFQAIFDDFGTPVPWITEATLAVASFLRAGWFVILPLGVAGLAAAFGLLGPGIAGLWPFSMFLRTGEQARLCELLAGLIDAHVPLPAALRTVGWASGDLRVAHDVADVADALEEGAPASSAIARRRYLPVQIRTAFRRADDPAAFAEALRGAAASLKARLGGRLGPAGLLAAAFQPLLMIVIGGFVILLCLSLFAPLLDVLNDLS
ncbi:MAG: type II secretion system F family protein, partial [Planctomycetota bacterium]